MNYEPNTTHWKPGDLVIHDADAKSANYLMRVIGYTKHGLVKSRYLDSQVDRRVCRSFKVKAMENDPRYLHDPARFGIELPSPAPARDGGTPR